MIEKSVALNMLQDIKDCIYSEQWKKRTLSTVKQYRKGLLLATNNDLKLLIAESKKYSENSEEYKKIADKINTIIGNIYNERVIDNE